MKLVGIGMLHIVAVAIAIRICTAALMGLTASVSITTQNILANSKLNMEAPI